MKRLILLLVFAFVTTLSTTESFAVPMSPEMSLDKTGVSIEIIWDPVDGADGYRLYYTPHPYTGPESIRSIDVDKLTEVSYTLWEDAAYYVAVTAYDDSGESPYSNIKLFLLKPHSEPSQGAPSLSLETEAIDLFVSWTAVPGATNYHLYYAPYPFTAVSTIGSINMGKTTEFNTTLWSDAAYYVAVTAVSPSGESGYSNIGLFLMGPPVPEWQNDGTGEQDKDGDGYLLSQGDCDDNNLSIYPNANDVCGDGIDQDCSGTDQECPDDQDSDSDGYSESQGDCNDEDETIHPEAEEICEDGIDQDCSGTDLLCPSDTDADSDGYSVNQGDCNDEDETIHPAVEDVCGDGIDQDCSGSDLLCPDDVDADGDGYSVNQGDCNDGDQTISPDAAEVCGDNIDQNCSGADLICPQEWFLDDDSDGYATGEMETAAERPGPGFFTSGELIAITGDCDDGNATIHPGADEICGDGIDQDCGDGDLACPAGELITWYRDGDGDSYSDGTTINAVARPSVDYFTDEEIFATSGDCNDASNTIHPNTWETCGDGVDQDCSGSDLLCPTGASSFEAELRTLINQYRSSNSLGPLGQQLALQGFSLEHNEYMIQTGDFSHAGFGDIRAPKSFALGCNLVVENLAWNFQTPQATFDGWRNSAGHNANMLTPEINFVGISKSGAYITMLGCRIP